MSSAEAEARRALNRLRRAVEKADRELGSLEASLKHAEGPDFPEGRYEQVRDALRLAVSFAEEEGARLAEKLLHAGGLEPGRVRRS